MACALAVCASATTAYSQQVRAKCVIYLNMQGGMSQLETFDPKPDRKALSGPTEAISTKIPNCRISSWLPKTAKILDRCLVLRNVETAGTHVIRDAQYFRLTGYYRRVTITHPDIGAWVKFMLPDSGPYFRINSDSYTGSGFFPSRNCEPIFITSPQLAVEFETDPEIWKARHNLLSQINAVEKPHAEEKSTVVTTFLSSKNAAEALAWDLEPDEVRERYGDHDFGKSCLLARRLREKANPVFIEVGLPGWDSAEQDYFENTERLCRQLDDGYSALIQDLEERNLLDSTLVVIATDFGRWVPEDERRRFSVSHSCAVLAGGGIQGGVVLGATKNNSGAEGDRVSARMLNAIIARALGIDPYKTEYSPDQRPFTIGNSREAEEGFARFFKSP